MANDQPATAPEYGSPEYYQRLNDLIREAQMTDLRRRDQRDIAAALARQNNNQPTKA